MQVKIFREFEFSAAHYLNNENHKSSRLHGHNYKLKIEVKGVVDENRKMIDFREIKKQVKPVLKMADHQNLNQSLKIDPTSCESLCIWFYAALKDRISGITKIEIRVTDKCGAIFEV